MSAEYIFHEAHGVYFKSVERLINAAKLGGLSIRKAEEIVRETAYAESPWLLLRSIQRNQYSPVIDTRLNTGIHHSAEMPLTTLEKRWLKAILADRRVKLFDIDGTGLEEVEPLFTESDIYICGQFSEGDDFNSNTYKERFQIILKALREEKDLEIDYVSGHKKVMKGIIHPRELQYSLKEDKFRLFAVYEGELISFNLSRMRSCQLVDKGEEEKLPFKLEQSFVEVVMTNERNTVERFLLTFSNYRRSTRKLEDGSFKVRVTFPKQDRMEVLVNILSFAPMAKIIAPTKMVELYRGKLERQKKLFQLGKNEQ